MLEALRAPCVVEGEKLFASASIGISLYPRDGDHPVALREKRADSAMYRAKLSGKNRFEFYWAAQDFRTRWTPGWNSLSSRFFALPLMRAGLSSIISRNSA